VLGNNRTGLVTGSGDCIQVVGGEDPKLAVDILTEGPDIYLGSLVTKSTYAYPSETIAKFDSYLATATATPGPVQSS
jgi:carboxypeptidase D